ncbi:FecR family protein [Pseudorhodoplanes sinuspersici]|uniref:Iron dicitrate transport regulator FecR n=1 Tax=Pseudorhodoplanes sinuspersici TaxID=1235591 RepID=A0A1W6ZM68_9HYPH|nr:FecR family protein [Pseudorhodoplanes sinuspersici]ARP98486.1 iron dicitrate transport regulator FecR [Pseudorhodoplanes sinuspersici]RKE65930.1 FecR family protein [Pseudorhodoplanes sinuspersici]
MAPEQRPQHADLALSDAAIDWVVKLHSGAATPADHAAFAAWRAQSDEHALAAREAEAIWQGVGSAGDKARQLHRSEKRAKLTRRAMLGGSAIVAGAALFQSGMIGPRLFADYTTGIGERRSVPLPDGSTVLLNASSALSVNFSEQERRLKLLEGQATFTVAHDAARPFSVSAASGETRAIGTVFDVDVRRAEVVVTVLEGVVATSTDLARGSPVRVSANQRIQYTSRSAPSAVQTIDADAETAWRRGKLIVNRKPLAEVITDIERYRRGQVVIVGQTLRSLEVTGVFDLSDPESVLQTIAETLPVRVVRLPLVTVIL